MNDSTMEGKVLREHKNKSVFFVVFYILGFEVDILLGISPASEYPEEYLPHLQHGESLKTKILGLLYVIKIYCLLVCYPRI
jgi:hypothetical protein